MGPVVISVLQAEVLLVDVVVVKQGPRLQRVVLCGPERKDSIVGLEEEEADAVSSTVMVPMEEIRLGKPQQQHRVQEPLFVVAQVQRDVRLEPAAVLSWVVEVRDEIEQVVPDELGRRI